MKATGKIIGRLIVGCAFTCCLSLFTPQQAFAIEGLQISVQSTNTVLSWPSDPSETYIVQYRNMLNATDSWATLADFYPAFAGTNQTMFVHSNQLSFSANISESSGEISLLSSSAAMQMQSFPPVPLAMPTDGSGAAVPVSLYPPGFDLSGFTVFDPISGESVSGADYANSLVQPSILSLDVPQPSDGPQPNGGGSGNSPAPTTGFYRVVRDGAHLFGITNGMTLSGVVTIPVEVANGSGSLANISLIENDSPVPGSSSKAPPFSSPLQLTIDTRQMANGTHQVSASARWDDTNGGVWELESSPVTINVYNEISFPNWMSEFGQLGDSLLITAQSAHTDADWYIDVYDSHYAYIGTFGDHTYDGNIGVWWDLIGPYGESHTNDSFFVFVVSTVFNAGSSTQNLDTAAETASPNANSGSAATVAPPTYRDRGDVWPGQGQWVIVAQHAFDNIQYCEYLYDELDGFVMGASDAGGVVPSPSDGHAYALHFGADDPQGDNDWAAFRQALYNPLSRNLVYFGHGAPNGLGYNPANANRYITATEIGNTLHTVPVGQTNRHAFRMVILDGCSTGKGTLPESFGIIHQENVPGSYYADASLRPSAFAGWSAEKYAGFFDGATVNFDHIQFIQLIQEYMALGNGIKTSVNIAGGMPQCQWVMSSQFKIYGCWDLTFWAFND
jgi:hypothetical protein